MRFPTYLAFLATVLATGCNAEKSVAQVEKKSELPAQVTFNAHIRPIFSDTCFSCHGFDAKTREAGLRLDTPEGAYSKLKDSEQRGIVPGIRTRARSSNASCPLTRMK